MEWIPVQSRQSEGGLRNLPLIAVDLGFAGDGNRSCGVAWGNEPASCEEMEFGAAVSRVSELLQINRESVLILEAPLSGAFSASGNPCARGEFEREPQRRYWYVQPGSGIALAAELFVRRPIQAVGLENGTVHIVEGFVTRVTGQHRHKRVAVALRRAFLDPQTPGTYWHSVKRGGNIHSVIVLFGSDANEAHSPVPVILKLPEADLAEL